MLYTTDYTPHMEEIYESYCAGGGRDLVCMAYLSYFANMYLTEDASCRSMCSARSGSVI